MSSKGTCAETEDATCYLGNGYVFVDKHTPEKYVFVDKHTPEKALALKQRMQLIKAKRDTQPKPCIPL